MKAKSVLYAAVGAPVVVARKVGGQAGALRERVSAGASTYGEAAGKAIEDWANEGEKVVTRLSEGKVVEEISAKVDLDQAKEQVSKLRDQLEDMLATWRTSFRPEKAEGEDEVKPEPEKASEEPASKTPAGEGPAEKKPATKTPAPKTKSTADRTSPSEPASDSSAEKAS